MYKATKHQQTKNIEAGKVHCTHLLNGWCKDLFGTQPVINWRTEYERAKTIYVAIVFLSGDYLLLQLTSDDLTQLPFNRQLQSNFRDLFDTRIRKFRKA